MTITRAAVYTKAVICGGVMNGVVACKAYCDHPNDVLLSGACVVAGGAGLDITDTMRPYQETATAHYHCAAKANAAFNGGSELRVYARCLEVR